MNRDVNFDSDHQFLQNIVDFMNCQFDMWRYAFYFIIMGLKKKKRFECYRFLSWYFELIRVIFYDVDSKRCRSYRWWYWSVICSFLFSLRFIQFIEISLFRFPFYPSWLVFFVCVIIWLGIVTNKFFLIILKIISLILSLLLALINLSMFFF